MEVRGPEPIVAQVYRHSSGYVSFYLSLSLSGYSLTRNNSPNLKQVFTTAVIEEGERHSLTDVAKPAQH